MYPHFRNHILGPWDNRSNPPHLDIGIVAALVRTRRSRAAAGRGAAVANPFVAATAGPITQAIAEVAIACFDAYHGNPGVEITLNHNSLVNGPMALFTPIPLALQTPSCPAHVLCFCVEIHNSPQIETCVCVYYVYTYVHICLLCSVCPILKITQCSRNSSTQARLILEHHPSEACTCRGSRRCGRSARGGCCRAGVNRDGINGNITPPVSTSRGIPLAVYIS